MDAMKDAMGAVAKKLGMSADDMRTALQGGESLTQLASSKGVSTDDLKNTIQSSLKADLPNASSTQLQNLTNRMISGPPRGAQPHASASTSGAGTSSTESVQEQFEKILESATSSSNSGSSGAGTGSVSIYA
jgi:hypothetical protein